MGRRRGKEDERWRRREEAVGEVGRWGGGEEERTRGGEVERSR